MFWDWRQRNMLNNCVVITYHAHLLAPWWQQGCMLMQSQALAVQLRCKVCADQKNYPFCIEYAVVRLLSGQE